MMRAVCDVHIPYRLVNFLRERSVDATHINRRLIALFDQHWAALRDVFDESRCYVEIGASGLRVFKTPIAQ